MLCRTGAGAVCPRFLMCGGGGTSGGTARSSLLLEVASVASSDAARDLVELASVSLRRGDRCRTEGSQNAMRRRHQRLRPSLLRQPFIAHLRQEVSHDRMFPGRVTGNDADPHRDVPWFRCSFVVFHPVQPEIRAIQKYIRR